MEKLDYRFRVHVLGKVQGVWFRKSTQDMAVKHNLNGWVKNMDDGSVMMEVEGALQECLEMIKWAEDGPAMARVNELQIEQLPPINDKYFTIGY
ncbi:MAG TPA: acylphosphatase [Flavobacteriales bacterium]|jgi:acylphosphatase|nr:acylphosphatase [Salibacteraceae bacterium]HAS36351.1 acylphosphatase [Flavobacteriales bacterium]